MGSPVPGSPFLFSDSELNALDPADSNPSHQLVLGDWLAFQRALGLKPQKAAELLRKHRHPATALRAVGVSAAIDRQAEIAHLSRLGVVAVPLLAPAYPTLLAAISDPASLLLVRGDVGVLSEVSVGIVGARAATVYGKGVARRLASDLAMQGIVVVSGLARGIDAEAHWGALEAGGRTVAVQACGIDRIYPREHSALADRIAENGAVITELPLGEPPLRPYFPLRNRLISGLSSAVVVVEARAGSGSLITANHAANQGRDVFAVPGPITAPTSVGTNRLIRDGAGVVLGAEEICDGLGWIRKPRARLLPARDLSELSCGILTALEHAPASRDELARRLQREPAELALELIELELANRIAEDRDGRLQIVS
jgi:DNA processing protein